VLAGGGSSLDAVVAAVRGLEDCPVFNAGCGAVLNEAGELELDAALMEGATRRAGAVAGVCRHRPIDAARAVLLDGRHVLLAGPGADAFAEAAGVAAIDASRWVTPFRRAQWERARERSAAGRSGGTVGAVARDPSGRMAAATSTGGILGKRAGRVSDSALFGCGTWADDATCAVSATGEGELFIRSAFAARVAAGLRAGRSLARACGDALADVEALGGSGGCIAVDRDGGLALPFDTPGMSRGVLREGGEPRVSMGPEAPDYFA
jgi:isoaspartyl peptidase/L-asparaginase-like protein (Ntn-hydrolase superfamily)